MTEMTNQARAHERRVERVAAETPEVRTWAAFTQTVKRPERRLLARLDRYSRPVLVAGCQCSGTTAVTQLVASADGIREPRIGRDAELDAALILAGWTSMPADGRHVFQTTYLNDRFQEYFDHDDFRLVWVVREPLSVVDAMLHRWRRGALNRLYDACGGTCARRWSGAAASAPRSLLRPTRLEKACAAYVGKVSQTFELAARLVPRRMIVVDYDELVLRADTLLPEVFEFLDLPYRPELAERVRASDARDAARPLPTAKAAYVNDICLLVYERARAWRIRERAAAA